MVRALVSRSAAVSLAALWVSSLGALAGTPAAVAATTVTAQSVPCASSQPPQHAPSVASSVKPADLSRRLPKLRGPRVAQSVASGSHHLSIAKVAGGSLGVSQIATLKGVSHDSEPGPVSPPDTNVSASPSTVVEAVNLSLLIMGHDGGGQQMVALGDLWQPIVQAVGAQSAQLSDPRIVYDQESQRWFSSIVIYESALLDQATASTHHSWIGLAASTNATPTSWNVCAVESQAGVLLDQPGLGVNTNKVTTGANDFDFSKPNAPWTGAELAVANKTEMMNGSNTVLVDRPSEDTTAFGYAPAVSLTPNTDAEYVPMNWQPFSGGQPSGPQVVKITTITGVPGVGSGATFGPPVSLVMCPSCGNQSVTGAPQPVAQPNTQVTVDPGDDRFLAAVYKDGELWTGGDTSVGSGPESAMTLFEVNTAGSMSLQVASVIDSGTGESFVYPNIALDANGTPYIAFSRGSGSEYMSSAAAVYLPASNAFLDAGVLNGGAGQGPYDCQCNGGTTRFGDYSGSAVDPADPSTVWVASEYSAVGDGNVRNWGTLLTRVTIDAPTTTSSSPGSGLTSGGTWVTINGNYLDENSSVFFGGVSAQAVQWNGEHQLLALSPPHRPGTYDITVQTPVATATLSWVFTFNLPPVRHGYWMDASDGGIFSKGTASFYGSTGNIRLNQPIVGMAARPQADGYWLVASDGGVFSFGPGVSFHGSMGGTPLNQPVVGMAATPSGNGYWLVARDGGVFTFGDAGFYGSTGNIRLNQPIVGMAPTPTGHGYWLVASDGGVFSFGDARFWGSTGNLRLNAPVVGMAALSDGYGYWLLASDGGVFSFGDAVFRGSTGNLRLNQPVVGMAQAGDDGGYWMVASDGGIFSFDSAQFYGSMGGTRLNQPVVGMAPGP